MRCHRLSSQAKPARLWHRLWCGECRDYRNVDRMLARGVRQVRKQAVPNLGMARTLVRLQGMEQSQETAVPRVQGAWLLNKRRLLPVMSVGLVLGSIYWVQDMNADPVVDIPNPTMPKPNAFDFYKAAGMLVVQDKEMQDALLPPPPAPIKQAKGRGTYPSTTKPVHLYTLEEKAQLLEANESALTVLQKGFLYPYQEPPARSVSALFPHYANFRSLARLLNFAATVKEEQEDWQGAMNCRLEAMRLGAESQRGGPLIGKLVGIACQAIGRQAAWDVIEHLDGDETKAAIMALEQILQKPFTFADTMQEEKWLMQASLLEIMRQPNWRREFAGFTTSASEEGESQPTGGNVALALSLMFYSKKHILDNITHYEEAVIANSRHPYCLQPPTPQEPTDPVSRILCPVFSQAYFKDAMESAENQMLLLSLALHAYRLDHHAYPKTLDALKGSYLTQVPNDPFVDRPFGYRLERAKYVLYSVGPDGKDDGGKPIYDTKQPVAKYVNSHYYPRYRVNVDSKGDIIAGLNR